MKDRRLTNLKSHDGHILMQDILPIDCRASMNSKAQTKLMKVIFDLCDFFKGLCGKVLEPSQLDE